MRDLTIVAFQSQTDDPTFVVLNNSVQAESVVITRSSNGLYYLESSNPIFDLTLTHSPQHQTRCVSANDDTEYFLYLYPISTTKIEIVTKDIDFQNIDGKLDGKVMQIFIK